MASDNEPVCGGCGYNLLGLGEVGRCPECGRFFSLRTGEGLRYAGNAEIYSMWLARRIRTVFLAVMAGFALVCSGATYFLSVRGPWIGSVFVLLFLAAAITSYLYEREGLDPEAPPEAPPEVSPVPHVRVGLQRPVAPPEHRCARCGYDLRGLPPRGRCPECDSPFDKGSLAGIRSIVSKHQRHEIWMSRLFTWSSGAALLLLLALIALTHWWWMGWRSTLWSGALVGGATLLYILSRATIRSGKPEDNTDPRLRRR